MTTSPAKIDISIIVLNYNAHAYLDKCVQSFIDSDFSKYKAELIVADSASTDSSFSDVQLLKNTNPNLTIHFLPIGQNLGFAVGNNRALATSNPHSRYVVFINPDTVTEANTIAKMIEYFDTHSEVDAATCYVEMALTGQLQPECHRGFPTPLNTFWHFFGFGLPKLFPHSKFINGYFMGHLDYTKPQIIDSCVGAFIMFKRSVGQEIGWWDERYFMYGEDLDICYQIKKHGYHLYFIPYWKIIHFQGVSSGLKKTKSAASRATKVRSAKATVSAMRIFYKNNLINDYPVYLRWLVMLGINLLENFRIFKAKFL